MSILKKILKALGWYYFIRYSSAYEKLFVKNKSVTYDYNRELAFLSSLISSGELVFDIGANNGYFTKLYLGLNARVVAVDPDKENVKILKARFRKDNRVTVVEKAVDSQAGQQELFINGDGSGFNTMSQKWVSSLQDPQVNRWHNRHEFIGSYRISTTTLENLIAEYGVPFFIKIDVEGYEFNVINTLTRRIQLITLEANLPEFLDETLLCIDHLVSIHKDYKFNVSEQYQFVFDAWKNGDDFCDYIRSTDLRYLEIWAKA